MSSKQPQNPPMEEPYLPDDDQDKLTGGSPRAANPGRKQNPDEQQDEKHSNNEPDQESPEARNPGVLGGTDTALDDERNDDPLTDRQIGNDNEQRAKKPSFDRRG